MPANTIYVGRGSAWGNEFIVGKMWTRMRMTPGGGQYSGGPVADRAHAVRLWQRFTAKETTLQISAGIVLRGKNLACWCGLCDRHKDGKPFDETCTDCQPCHADPLGRLANR